MAAEAAKVEAIRTHFAPLLGKRIVHYRTAELRHEDGTWSPWSDLPIQIYTDDATVVSVSWSCFDDLALSNGPTDPSWADPETTRWIENGIGDMNGCLGRVIRGVSLGHGQMAIGDREIEIWTRLLLDLGDRWLEIYNALDENGYCLHHGLPSGQIAQVFGVRG